MLDEVITLILEDARERMGKTVSDLEARLRGIRAGRASPVMLQEVLVPAYDRMQPLHHMASITAPQADLIVVQPWDRATLHIVTKAILSSNLGLNPSSDGTFIRVPIPPLTEERRRQLVKRARQLGENAKVSLRNIRRQAKDDIKDTQEEERLSEDMRYLAEDQLQELTNQAVAQVDQVLKRKQAAIMEI